MQLGILLGIISFFLVGFGSCGIKEPKGDFCVALEDGQKHCIPTDDSLPEYRAPIGLGDIIVTPEFFGELKKHHKELHQELDSCGNNL